MRQRGASREAKRLLYALAAGVENQRVEIDASEWKLTAESTGGVRAELADLLKEHTPPARPSDLWRILEHGVGGMLAHSQLYDALIRVGFPHGQRWLVPDLAKEV